MHRVRYFICLSLVLCLSLKLAAQNHETSISGTVTDPTGALVRGATVDVLAHNAVVATVTTNQKGRYIASVPGTGTYEIRVNAPGFKMNDSQVVVSSGPTTTIRDITLRLNSL